MLALQVKLGKSAVRLAVQELLRDVTAARGCLALAVGIIAFRRAMLTVPLSACSISTCRVY